MAAALRAGEEFREDLRAPGARDAQARRLLTPAELAPLTQLSAAPSVLAVVQTFGLIAAAIALALLTWPGAWVAASIVAIGIAQRGLFILAHEAAHYRLFANRRANDLAGRAIGMAGGVSMCTYRVTHRLHHDNLYSEEDPDTAIQGGYPRGRRYLRDKLLRDLAGLNAWKTFAYFSGSPVINDDTRRAIPHHVNYHLEHHLYPAVPHYRLPRPHALLRDKGALEGAEVRDVRATWKLVHAERRRP